MYQAVSLIQRQSLSYKHGSQGGFAVLEPWDLVVSRGTAKKNIS